MSGNRHSNPWWPTQDIRARKSPPRKEIPNLYLKVEGKIKAAPEDFVIKKHHRVAAIMLPRQLQQQQQQHAVSQLVAHMHPHSSQAHNLEIYIIDVRVW